MYSNFCFSLESICNNLDILALKRHAISKPLTSIEHAQTDVRHHLREITKGYTSCLAAYVVILLRF